MRGIDNRKIADRGFGQENETKRPRLSGIPSPILDARNEDGKGAKRFGGKKMGQSKEDFSTANNPPSLIELPPSPSYCGQAGGQAQRDANPS